MLSLMLVLFNGILSHAMPTPSPDLTLAVMPHAALIDNSSSVFKTCSNIVNKEAASTYGPAIQFSRVLLDWRDPVNDLTITGMRVVLKGSGVRQGNQAIFIPYNELASIFGTTVVPPDRLIDSAKTKDNGPRSFERNLPACGLTIANFVLDSSGGSTTYSIDVELQLFGVAVSPDYKFQLDVMTTTNATADYVPAGP